MNRSVFYKLLFLALFVVFLIVYLTFVPVSAYDFNSTEKENFCSYFNYSFSECSDFWDGVEDTCRNFTVNCSYENYTLTSECSNFTEEDCNCSNDLGELEKIDAYQKRGYEPVFDGEGDIKSWKKRENDSCESMLTEDECDKRISEEISDRGLDDSSSERDSSNSSDEIFGFAKSTFVALLVVLFVGAFVVYWKFKPRFSRTVSSSPDVSDDDIPRSSDSSSEESSELNKGGTSNATDF